MPRPVLRPDRYTCSVCARPYGELMNTGLLSQHIERGGDGYTLCKGSKMPIAVLKPTTIETPHAVRRPARGHTPGQQELPLWEEEE